MSTLTADCLDEAKPRAKPESPEELLRAVEPSAVLLPGWLLQNVIAADRGLGGSPFMVPHRKIHLIERTRLLKIARDEHLSLPQDLPAAQSLILLARSEKNWLSAESEARLLRHYWRLLFHARVDATMRSKLPATCAREDVEARIDSVGRAAFCEARFVLRRERYLHAQADDREAYAEFAAVYLELLHFQPELLEAYFPTSAGSAAVREVLAAEIDADALLRATCPCEAAKLPPPPLDAHPHAAHVPDAGDVAHLRERVERDAGRRPRLLARADRAAALGNTARAATLRKRVFQASHDKAVYAAAMLDLDRLIDRLAAALDLTEPAKHEWRSALGVLLAHAAGGWWNPEDRLLYDLQKVCVYHEREIYSVGVVEWLLELCRRPLRRPQPNQRIVLMVKALRTALDRVPGARLTPLQRDRLTRLLHDAEHHLGGRLRRALRPLVTTSLRSAGLCPADPTEQVAEDKLTEELIDGLAHRGFLTMSLVRDAVSRNQIKFPDIASPARFFTGDPLLRIDRQLGDSLDGVYHRGEIYLRFFQRASSVLFATRLGRFVTRTVLMPLGGSYLILEALDHTLFLILRLVTGWHWLKLGPHDERHAGLAQWFTHPLFLGLAVTLLGVINWPAFRAAVGRALGMFGRALGLVLVDAPCWVAKQPWVKAIARSQPARLATHYLVKPLVFAALAMLFVPHRAAAHARWEIFGGIFVLANFLLNSRSGRVLEQAVAHWLRVIATRITSDLVVNLFYRITSFFEKLLEDVDRMLYAVDEWLRFRAGQGRASLLMKAGLGVFWFFIAYVTRFAVNLLVEPQVNPIKHFPVVTVSHKIILPQVKHLADALEQLGMHRARANPMAAGIVSGIPGIFGFLAWELRSNWQLYRANRSKNLKPVSIGSHGESMVRLLRPGFHSGTVPKIFQRLRRAKRHFYDLGRTGAKAQSSAHKQVEAAEHVREAVGRFVEREIVALLNQHPAWRETPVSIGAVKLCATRIGIELFCPALDPAGVTVFFEQRHGWILAGIDGSGWLSQVSAAQSALFSAALLGLYKMCGVDVVEEQIESLFGPRPVAFDLTRDGLIIWADRNFGTPVEYDLRQETPGSPYPRRQLLLSEIEMPREEWIQTWKSESPEAASPNFHVLPGNFPAA